MCFFDTIQNRATLLRHALRTKWCQHVETSYQEWFHRTVRWKFDDDTCLPLPNPGADFEEAKSDGLYAGPTEWAMSEQVGLETMQEDVGC